MNTATDQIALQALSFDNRFARLDPAMGSRLAPLPLSDPYLVAASAQVANMLGLAPEMLESP